MVPKKMKGKILYPLNVLKKKYPTLYKKEVQKYDGRKKVLQGKIPSPFNCLWNDVLHFSPVEPSKVMNALKKEGFPLATLKW